MEQYSLEKALAESEEVRKKAQEAKDQRGEGGEPESSDYANADKILGEDQEKIEIPKSKTIGHFWNGIINGKYKELTDDDIEKMIDHVYLSEQPLTQLTGEEISKIKESLRKAIKEHAGGSTLKELAENEVVFFPPISDDEAREKSGRVILKDGKDLKVNYWNDKTSRRVHSLEIYDEWRRSMEKVMISKPHFFIVKKDTNNKFKAAWQNDVIPVIRQIGGKTLNKKQKIEKYSDIEVWEKAEYHNFGSGAVVRQGYRELYEEDKKPNVGTYGYTKENFIDLLAEIKKRVKRNNITMLDVGGGLGTACFQAEQLDPNLKTTNLTIEEEPAMYPVETVIAPAEAMPATFKEKYDLILSNIAFRYFPYPDIALENCLKSLSVGGEARLGVSTDRVPIEVKDYATRLSREYKRLKELSDKGFIKLEVQGGFEKSPLDYIPKDEKYFPSAFVRIIKLKSLEDKI